uniref:Uncharacterized protein n=1 Tax=Mycena chlorophos TaxID=658473 RepID=A0ABQ0LXQ7_MYCCL|nr:predicted protein [Mycena chlorophos]
MPRVFNGPACRSQARTRVCPEARNAVYNTSRHHLTRPRLGPTSTLMPVTVDPQVSYAIVVSALSLIPHDVVRIASVVLSLALGMVYYYLLVTKGPAMLLAELDALVDETEETVRGAAASRDFRDVSIVEETENLLRVKQSASICRCLLLESSNKPGPTWANSFKLRRYLSELIADVRKIKGRVQLIVEHDLQRLYAQERLVTILVGGYRRRA